MTKKLHKSAIISLLAVLLCAVLVLGGIYLFAPNAAQADATVSVWDGNLAAAGWGVEHTAPVAGIAKDAAEGASTKPAGYVATFDETDETKVKTVGIGDAAAFAYFAREIYEFSANYEGATVALKTDIDLNNKLWIPIGIDNRKNKDSNGIVSLYQSFKGTFDGENHTVSNLNGTKFAQGLVNRTVDGKEGLYIPVGENFVSVPSDDNEYSYGLFCAAANVTIKNVNLAQFTLDGTASTATMGGKQLEPDGVGGLIGFAGGHVTVENCTVGSPKAANDNEPDIKGTRVTGGMVGRAYVAIKDDGGFDSSGNPSPVLIKDCTNYLNIGIIGDPAQKGGILGFCYGTSKFEFENCTNHGNLAGQYVGGITAFIQQSQVASIARFENCTNNGDVTATGYCAGGIIGRLYGEGGNVHEMVLTNCVNRGDVTSIENRSLGSSGTPHQFTGGIAGQLDQSVSRKLTANGLYNFGKIYGAATDDTVYGSNRLYSYAGGIFGDMRLTQGSPEAWQNGGQVESEYPFNRVSMSNIVNVGEITAAGEYRGRSLFVGGLIGAVTCNQDVGWNYTRIDAENWVNACGSVNTIDFYGKIENDIRKEVVYRDLGIVQPASDVTTAQLKLSADGKTVLGIDGEYTGAIKVVIPNTVTAIADGAFSGMGTLLEKGLILASTASSTNNRQHIFQKETPTLVAVEFESGSTLETIGEFAFAGTDVTTVNLPASVKEVGKGSFAQTQLAKIVINSSAAKLDDMAFGNNLELVQVEIGEGNVSLGTEVFGHQEGKSFNVIAANKEQYDSIVGTGVENTALYPVTIEYYDLGVMGTPLVGTETKLFGKPYTMIKGDDGIWFESNAVTYVGLPSLGAENTPWYADTACVNPLNVSDLTQMLAEEGVKTIKLYTRAVGEGSAFIARADIVYDGTEYPLSAINALLASYSKKATNEQVTILSFTKIGAAQPETPVPTSFRDAGTYEVTIGDEQITVTIAKAKIYLADASTLEWRVNGTITLLDRDGLIDSVVRSRGDEFEMRLGLHNAASKGYKVTIEEDIYAYGADIYESTFVLIADDNHEFVDGKVADAEARGLDVTYDPVDGTVEVVKTWRVVDMDNYFVGADNNDYTIADRVYGSIAAFGAPRLLHGSESDITLELYRNGALVNNKQFTVAELNKYLNRMMPVGEYTLRMLAADVDYEHHDEYDSNGNPIEDSLRILHCAAFEQQVTFAVTPATLNATQVETINDTLNGKTFKFIIGASNTSSANRVAQSLVGVALEELRRSQPNVTIEGNVWTAANTAVITVNPVAAMSNVYSAFTKPATAGVYNYYYRLSLANYNTVDSLGGKALSFTVVAYGEVEIPTITSKVFNHTQQAADIVGNGQYSVTTNNGGINAGEYDVVLTLLQPECHLWKGQTVDNNTATQTLKFAITKADNEFTVALNMLGWNYETFDVAVNNIRATMRYLDDGQSIHFRVVKKGETTAENGLTDFTIDANGKVSAAVAELLNALKVGKYELYAKVNGTDNYNEFERNVTFAVSQAINTWADGEGDLVLPSWIVGKFSLEENAIVVKATHGEAIIEIRDIYGNGNVYYNSLKPEENTLNELEAGKYSLVAWVPESADYAALYERTFTIEVLQKIGLPWWGTTLITVGALAAAAIVILILWKLKVFEILTDKISLAITTRATVDATIAAVRATKRAEEADEHKRKVEARERLAAAREAHRNKTPEQRAQDLHAKAEATATKAERMNERAAKMRERANKLAGNIEQPEEAVEQPDDTSTED